MSGWGNPHALDEPDQSRMQELDRLISREDRIATAAQKEARRAAARERRFESMKARMRFSQSTIRADAARGHGVAAVINHVAQTQGVPAALIVCGRKTRTIVEVTEARRQIAVILRARGWSYPKIGRALNMHHTSIMHLVDKVKPRPASRALYNFSREIPYPDLSGEWAI